MASSLLLRRLPFALLLALRYLKSTRRDAFASFLSTVAAVSIGVGVAALVLVLAALAGLHEQLLGQVLASTPEMLVELPAGADVAAAAAGLARLPGAERVQRVLRGQGWVVYAGAPEPVKLIGYEGEAPASFPGLAGAPAGLYLPGGLARRWGLEAGERVQVVSPRPTLSPLGPQPRIRTLVVAGLYEAAPTQTTHEAAVPLAAAESLLGRPARELQLAFAKPAAALAAAAAAQALAPPGSRVRTWRDLNRSLYFVLGLEKTLLAVAVGLIVLVAALALVVDLGLVIANKRAEIGILGTMGASAAALRNTFVYLGGLLAMAGLAVGLAVGTVTAWALDRWRVLAVPGDVMFVDHIPFRLQAGDVALVAATTAALVLAASWVAGRRAAALRPIEAMER